MIPPVSVSNYIYCVWGCLIHVADWYMVGGKKNIKSSIVISLKLEKCTQYIACTLDRYFIPDAVMGAGYFCLWFCSLWPIVIVLRKWDAVNGWSIEKLCSCPACRFGSRTAILAVFSKKLRGWFCNCWVIKSCSLLSVEYKWECELQTLLLLSFFICNNNASLVCLSCSAQMGLMNVGGQLWRSLVVSLKIRSRNKFPGSL